MLNVYVVEDERQIREGLLLFLSEMPQINMIAAFSDAQSALPKIIADPPDLVITDIVMKEMSGIELIKKCRENGVMSEFIIISGYNEFEYAQAAIRYGVFEYIEKPVDHEILKNALERVVEKEENRAETTQALVMNILEYGKNAKKSTLDRFEGVKFRVMKVNFRSEAIDEDGEPIEKLLKKDIKNLCSDLIVCSVKYGLATCVLVDRPKRADALEKYMTKLRSYPYAGRAVCGISSFGEAKRLKELDKEAQKAIMCACVRNIDTVRAEQLSYYANLSDNSYYINSWYDILTVLKSMDYHSIESGIFNVIDHLEATAPAYTVYDFTLKCVRFMGSLVPEYNYDDMMALVLASGSMQELKQNVQYAMKKACVSMAAKNSSVTDSSMEEIINYLKLNYMRNDITAKMIAQKMYLNPEYFSRKFKAVTGTNYNEYITNLRMNKAKELLTLSNYSISKISDMVGYQTVRYFSKVFKKYVGVMPKEYRSGAIAAQDSEE